MPKWLDELNEQQRQAATHIDGPLFVVAGAGSGKTKTLTARITYLISQVGINPSSILAVTFTNKAAHEMKERIINLAGPYAQGTWIYTFHSFGVQVLRKDIEELNLGYTRKFNIIDEDDAKQIIKESIKELNLDPKEYRIAALRGKISKYKVLNLDLFDDNNERAVYKKYSDILLSQNLLDFDDLIILTYKLLLTVDKVLNYYQEKFNYILVDEFQDTDQMQYKILSLLAHKHRNLFVVGDPDQSIYGFRGADYQNAYLFKQEFGKEHNLTLNYRSTQEILDYANNLITHNSTRPFIKSLEADNKSTGIKPIIANAESDFNEANLVANEIRRLVSIEGYKYQDIAVLYRNNALSRIFEDTFIKHQIPYIIYGGVSFYQRREIKDILAFLRITLNHSLDFYLKRVINIPKRSIGASTLLKIEEKAQEYNISMFDAIDYIDASAKVKSSLNEFKQIIKKIETEILDANSLGQVIKICATQTGYIRMLEEEKDDIALDRIDNIKELESVFLLGDSFYEGSLVDKLNQLLDQIALYTDLDQSNTTDKVILATVHQVKGLEFRAVFVCVLEEDIFPSNRSFLDIKDLEEERRIAYVAITRAKERLYLTYAQTRLLYGQWLNARPSRFIKEMMPKHEFSTSRKTTKTSLTNTFLKDGDKVYHDAFGAGIVINVNEGVARIAFGSEHGIKMIQERHPSLKKMD